MFYAGESPTKLEQHKIITVIFWNNVHKQSNPEIIGSSKYLLQNQQNNKNKK